MAYTLTYGTYNPGDRYFKYSCPFNPAPVNNIPHKNIHEPNDGDDWRTHGITSLYVSAAASGVVVRSNMNPRVMGRFNIHNRPAANDLTWKAVAA